MKDKILEVIHKELENIGNKNIFRGRNNESQISINPINPIVNENKCIGKIYFPNDWRHKDTRYETCECLQYILVFEDGNPPIEVSSVITTDYHSEEVKKKYLWFFEKGTKEIAYSYTNTVVVSITCGKFSFKLTEDEKNELLERTKFAYQRYKLEDDKQYEDEINKKLDLRLKKWEKQKK